MNIIYLFRSGLAELWHNKLRSFLSFLAIAVGVATFTYIGMTISSAKATLDKMISVAGGTTRIGGIMQSSLNIDDYWKFKAKMPKATVFSIYNTSYMVEALHGKNLINFPFIVCVTPEDRKLDWVYRLEGRFITWEDVIHKHNVIVLLKPARERDEKKERYFKGWNDRKGIPVVEYSKKHSMLNEKLVLLGKTFTVVGILHAPLQEDDLRYHSYYSPTGYVPFGSLNNLYYTEFDIVTNSISVSEMYRDELERYTKNRDKDNFFSSYTYLKRFSAQNKSFKDDYLDVLILGIITLIAGGVGIMNISLAGIYARVREIGIRRALGAGKAAIVAQFLIEALILGFCGGVVGLAGGFIVIEYAEASGQMSWWIPIGAVLSGVLTSFVFSLYPAFVASKLNPIDALKYE